MDGDGVGSLLEEDAVVADAEAEEAVEFAGEGLDSARSRLGVTVDGFKNRHGDLLRDGSDLGWNPRLEVDLFHESRFAPRI